MIKTNSFLVMVGTCIMIFLVNLDTSIVNLALPAISKTLDKPIILTQWILTSYLLAAMVFFIVCGRLADHFGKKTVILIGCFCFFVSSIILSISNTLPVIIAMRIIQGIGFAATLNLALLINTELFPAEKQGLALGISITLTGLGQALGPTLAGLLLTYFNWHSLFIFNIPFSFLSFVCILLFYRAHEVKHHSAPWFDFKLFKISAYNNILLIRFIFMYCWNTILFFMPIYLQNYLHNSPLVAGYSMLFMTCLLGGGSIIVGRMLDRFSAAHLMLIAMLGALVSFILFYAANHFLSNGLLFVALAIFGTYCGIMFPSTIYAGIHSLPVKQKGVGMGIFFSGSFLFATFGVTVASHLTLWISAIPSRFVVLLVIMLVMTLLAIVIQKNSSR